MENNIENPMQNIQSLDWNKERLDKLKQLMPDLFTNDGKLNINELKQIIEPESLNETERYEFRWFGKSKAKREAFTPTDATLVFDEERSVNPEHSENLIIEGENLQVLKLLSKSYREQIKCIYIDPPYNTGKDFVYTDNFDQDKKEYWEDAEKVENGVKIDTNMESDGRYHSNWLNMMYSRLLIARQLLKEDGVIFISIDDNEVHHLRKLSDEVFGEENFISEIVWERSYAPINMVKHFSKSHDYILCYAKNIELLECYGLVRSESTNAKYGNPDNDQRGLWRTDNLSVGPVVESKVYEIITPNGRKCWPPKGRCWLYSKERYEEMVADNRIWFGEDGNNIPAPKRFLAEVKQGMTPMTIWKYIDVGHNQDSMRELREIFDGEKIFDYSKPVNLMKQILQLYTSEDDIIIDFFAGSGTTAHATMELNQIDGGNRKFLCIQLPEATDEKSDAFKAGYKKISDITIERNKRVINNIIEEKKKAQPDLFSQKQDDQEQLKGLGFKVFKLQKSNFPRTEFAPDPDKSDDENVSDLLKYIKEKENQLVTAFNSDELITEILLKNGFKLNYSLTKQDQFKKNDVILATDGEKETLICLDNPLSDEFIEYFKTNTSQKLIVLERSLDTTKKWNLKHYLGDKFIAF
jgi:adenine-specific DNA-methyltransferase